MSFFSFFGVMFYFKCHFFIFVKNIFFIYNAMCDIVQDVKAEHGPY